MAHGRGRDDLSRGTLRRRLVRPREPRAPPGRHDFTPDLILALHVLVNATAIGTLLHGVASGRLPRWRVGDATLSTGPNSGISGIVVAHELIHRRACAWCARWDREPLDGQLCPFLHRARQGPSPSGREPRSDPSTARPGETIYHYLLRSLPGQFISALRIEADRLAKRGAPVRPSELRRGDDIRAGRHRPGDRPGARLACLDRLPHAGDNRGLPAPDGELPPAFGAGAARGVAGGPGDSWQSDRVSGRFLLLELPRHADHHGHAAKPYHTLVSYDDSPTLPLGLLGTIPVLLIPPLWFALSRRAVSWTCDPKPPARVP